MLQDIEFLSLSARYSLLVSIAPAFRIFHYAHAHMLYLVTIGAVAFTWYHCRETERETRRIAAARHAAGKQTGEVLEEDVHVGRL